MNCKSQIIQYRIFIFIVIFFQGLLTIIFQEKSAHKLVIHKILKIESLDSMNIQNDFKYFNDFNKIIHLMKTGSLS